jgi:hypothetical protein
VGERRGPRGAAVRWEYARSRKRATPRGLRSPHRVRQEAAVAYAVRPAVIGVEQLAGVAARRV